MERGAKIETIDNRGRTPLHDAIDEERLEVAKELLEYGAKTDIKDNSGKTPLHYAEWIDYLEGVKELLKNGAKTDIKDNAGKTPLHYAVYKEGSADVAKELLTHGANANIKDNVGDTPLFYAVQNGSLDVVKELLKYGAKVDIKNNKGKTPLDYAKNEEMKDLLRNGQMAKNNGNAVKSLSLLGGVVMVAAALFYRRKAKQKIEGEASAPQVDIELGPIGGPSVARENESTKGETLDHNISSEATINELLDALATPPTSNELSEGAENNATKPLLADQKQGSTKIGEERVLKKKRSLPTL